MDCATFKDLAALFALGALEPAERAACEAHLASTPHHPDCFEALSSAMAGVASLDEEGVSEEPAPHVWAAIERQITPGAQRLRRVRRRTWVATGAALACAAALVLVLVGRRQAEHDLSAARRQLTDRDLTATAAVRERDACLVRVQRVEDAERLRHEAVALLELSGTRLFPLAPEKGRKATANAIMHTGVKRAYVVADGLQPVPDRDYEMWIAKGKRVVPAGLVNVDAHGRAVVRIDYAALLGDIGAPDAMMITLEPRGGGPVVRGPTVLLGAPRT